MLWWTLRQLRSTAPRTRSLALLRIARDAARLRGDERAARGLVDLLEGTPFDERALDALCAISGEEAVAYIAARLDTGVPANDLVGWIGSDRAIQWLGDRRDQRITSALTKALGEWRSHKELACRVAQTLAQIDASAVRETLFEYLQDADEVAMALVGQHLVRTLDAEGKERLVALISRRFFGGSPRDGLFDIVSSAGAAATAPLLELAQAGSERARTNAIRALQWDPRGADVESLHAALAVPGTTAIAAGLLGKIGHQNSVGPLMEALQGLPQVGFEVDRAALETALNALGHPVYSHEGERARQETIKELILRLATRAGRQGTRDRLDDFEPRWRASPAARLAIPELAIAMLEGDSDTFQNASWLLGQIDESWRDSEELEAAIPRLISGLGSVDPETRRHAEIVLEGVHRVDCEQALERMRTRSDGGPAAQRQGRRDGRHAAGD